MGVIVMKRSSEYYSKLDKEDPEEIKSRKAQFLIYRTLQKADSGKKKQPSFLRVRLCRIKIKIGRKLKTLRRSMVLSMSAARLRIYKQITIQWKRLFTTHGEAIATLPAAIFPAPPSNFN